MPAGTVSGVIPLMARILSHLERGWDRAEMSFWWSACQYADARDIIRRSVALMIIFWSVVVFAIGLGLALVL